VWGAAASILKVRYRVAAITGKSARDYLMNLELRPLSCERF
jgi:hypothetical protein